MRIPKGVADLRGEGGKRGTRGSTLLSLLLRGKREGRNTFSNSERVNEESVPQKGGGKEGGGKS